jgi:hypothetical protein
MHISEKKLKLGLLIDSILVPAWIYHSLERIANSNYAEFSLIILNAEESVDGTKADDSSKIRNQIIYNIFNKLDKWLFLKKPNALQLKNLHEIVGDTPIIQVETIQNGSYEYFDPADINRIHEHGLDILVKLGFGNLRGDILTSAKNGVWAYHPSELIRNRENFLGFWEVFEKCPDTSASLLRLGEDLENNEVLFQSWFSTYPLSPAQSRNSCLWAASSFLPREIERLQRIGIEKYISEIEKYNTKSQPEDRQCKIPTNALMSKLILSHLISVVSELYQRALYHDCWHLLINLQENEPLKFQGSRKVMPPKDRFWADPHVQHKDGHYYIFIEEFIYKSKKGHISVIEMDQQGNYQKPVQILKRDYHFSYPFVFERENQYYMIPESAQHKTIELYECVEFPYKWQFMMNLMENIRAVDTTLFYHLGTWWLFTAITENEGAFPQRELYLFYANDPITTKWNPHPKNPIVSDVKNARPAGKIFIRNQKIYRPSQNCSGNYGNSFDLNEVLILTKTEYIEKKAVSVKPVWDKNVRATHTYSNEEKFIVIDALMKRNKILQWG